MEEILKQLRELRKTRIACYSKRVKIKQKEGKDFIIDLENNDNVIYNNIKILYDKIVVEDRILKFIIYDDYNHYDIDVVTIDLSEGYIEIYDGFEGAFLFTYKEFKPDQLTNDINLDDYPKLSYSIEDSQLVKDYYEIIITIRMSPLDEYDYNIKLFSFKNESFDAVISLMQIYRNFILNGTFSEFFQHDSFVFQDDYNDIKKNEVYKVIEHHFNEYYFTAKPENGDDSEIINIPYVAVLTAIGYINEEPEYFNE